MWQTLFYIPRQIQGVPLFGFGALAALWLLSAVAWLAWLARRHGWAEVRAHLPVWLLFGAAIVWFLPHVGDQRGLPVRGFGTMLLVAIGSGTALGLRRAGRLGFHADLVFSLLFWMVVPGIVGARLFYVVEYWDQFRADTWTQTMANLAQVTEGGLVVYGGALGAAVGFLALVRIERLPALALLDLVAPSGALAMGLGRLGCFLNGCCFGGPSELPWAVAFPFASAPYVSQVRHGQLDLLGLYLESYDQRPAVVARVVPSSPAAAAGLVPGQRIVRVGQAPVDTGEDLLFALLSQAQPGRALPTYSATAPQPQVWALPGQLPASRRVHPTQLYSALDGLLLSAWLLAVAPFCRRPGQVFCWYLTLYPVSRFLQEMVRSDEAAALATRFTISQNMSLMLLAVACGLWFYVRRQPPAESARATQMPRTTFPAAPRQSSAS